MINIIFYDNPMNTELYNKIFQRLDELGANGIKVIHKKPDRLKEFPLLEKVYDYQRANLIMVLENQWDSSKPLKDQSDEFGEKLYSLIK